MEAQHFVIVFESRKYNYIYHSYESYDRHSNRGCTVDGGRKACNTCRNASHGLSYRGSRAKASFTACFRTQTVSLQVVTLFGKSHAPRRAILASESRAAGTAFTTAVSMTNTRFQSRVVVTFLLWEIRTWYSAQFFFGVIQKYEFVDKCPYLVFSSFW